MVAVITEPLFTAVTRHLDQPRVGAVPDRQRHLLGAQGHAAHHPVHAAALVLAVGLEVLPVLVDPAVKLAGAAVCLRCRGGERTAELLIQS